MEKGVLFAQDLIYPIANGRIKTRNSILLPTMVKTLTNNTEVINILNKLGHGISYSVLIELQTETAYNIYEQQMTNDCIIPANCKKEAFTKFVADNIDRNEKNFNWLVDLSMIKISFLFWYNRYWCI